MLDEAGLLLPWPRARIELPSWREAYSLPVDREPGPIWRWKEVLPQQRKGYYGKLLRKGPCLVSLSQLPYFYSMAQRNGEREEYLYNYRMGRLSALGKQVMDHLFEKWPLTTFQLRERLLLTTRETHSQLNRALDELQAGMFACVVAASDEDEREYTYYWGPVDQAFPESVAAADEVSSSEAAARLIGTYVRTVVSCQKEYPAWLFSLNARTYERALRVALDGGRVSLDEAQGLLLTTDLT
jgi:hypothetical protein